MRFIGTLRAAVLGFGILIGAGVVPAMAADKPATRPTSKPAKPTTNPTTRPTTKPTQTALEKFKVNVDSLKLSDEQKPKIEALFTAAEASVKALPTADPKDHTQKVTVILDKLRTDVADLLTADQDIALVKKVWSPFLISKGKHLHKPEMKLDEQQLKKVDDLIDNTLLKLEELSEQGRHDKKDIQPTLKVEIAAMQTDIEAVLTDEQKKMYSAK